VKPTTATAVLIARSISESELQGAVIELAHTSGWLSGEITELLTGPNGRNAWRSPGRRTGDVAASSNATSRAGSSQSCRPRFSDPKRRCHRMDLDVRNDDNIGMLSGRPRSGRTYRDREAPGQTQEHCLGLDLPPSTAPRAMVGRAGTYVELAGCRTVGNRNRAPLRLVQALGAAQRATDARPDRHQRGRCNPWDCHADRAFPPPARPTACSAMVRFSALCLGAGGHNRRQPPAAHALRVVAQRSTRPQLGAGQLCLSCHLDLAILVSSRCNPREEVIAPGRVP
jgi:hypothetical protein